MELKIRVWASNDEYPKGRMFYPEDEDNPFMLNMHGDLLTARQKAPHNFDCTYARIGYNGIEIMLYTGLKDKNGKEIYESDIVQWKTRRFRSAYTGLKEDNGKFQTITWKSVVEWDMQAFCITESFDPINQRNNSPLIPDETFEIIGNIHENISLIIP